MIDDDLAALVRSGARLGIDVPEAYRAGVADTLTRLFAQARLVMDFVPDRPIDEAEEFEI